MREDTGWSASVVPWPIDDGQHAILRGGQHQRRGEPPQAPAQLLDRFRRGGAADGSGSAGGLGGLTNDRSRRGLQSPPERPRSAHGQSLPGQPGHAGAAPAGAAAAAPRGGPATPGRPAAPGRDQQEQVQPPVGRRPAPCRSFSAVGGDLALVPAFCAGFAVTGALGGHGSKTAAGESKAAPAPGEVRRRPLETLQNLPALEQVEGAHQLIVAALAPLPPGNGCRSFPPAWPAFRAVRCRSGWAGPSRGSARVPRPP